MAEAYDVPEKLEEVEGSTEIGEGNTSHRRTIGAVTTGAGAGSAVGGALVAVLIQLFGLQNWSAEAVAGLTTVISAALAFAGGYLVPSRKGELQYYVASSLVLRQSEREDLVSSAAQQAASLSLPDLGQFVTRSELSDFREGSPTSSKVESSATGGDTGLMYR